MNLKIINKKEYPLLSRTKVESEIVFEKSTPSREEIKNKLSEVLGKDGKLIIVKGIYTSYGLKKAKNVAYAYENEESLKRIEAEKKKGKKKKETKKEGKAESGEQKPKESKAEGKQESPKEKEPVKEKE